MARITERSVQIDADLERFGKLMSKADAYAPLAGQDNPLPANVQIYDRVWSEASKMRDSGKLLRLARRVRCPVVAVHGDYDPHPADSISRLAGVFRGFRFVLLEKCGHYPWLERHARDRFLDIIRAEVGSPGASLSATDASE
jgi:pimeloyl-ACP methyl ester carboxylesterase